MREIRITQKKAREELAQLSPDQTINYFREYLLDLLAVNFWIQLRQYTPEQLEILIRICDEKSGSTDELLDFIVDTGTPDPAKDDNETIKYSVKKAVEDLRTNASSVRQSLLRRS